MDSENINQMETFYNNSRFFGLLMPKEETFQLSIGKL